LRADPHSALFDPLKAAILLLRQGNLEEACWLAFLSIHFGRHKVTRWRYCAAVYGGKPEGAVWDWPSVAAETVDFTQWLARSAESIRMAGGGFGNHRKYESLASTGTVVSSYVSWIGPAKSQQARFRGLMAPAKDNEPLAFDLLYTSMHEIVRFGRTARFDFLTLLSRLRLLSITPGNAYLQSATGPLHGARLLFGDVRESARMLDDRLIGLDQHLQLGFDVLEDALCNWQKNPTEFIPFRG